jgi:hypothetical protein
MYNLFGGRPEIRGLGSRVPDFGEWVWIAREVHLCWYWRLCWIWRVRSCRYCGWVRSGFEEEGWRKVSRAEGGLGVLDDIVASPSLHKVQIAAQRRLMN